MAEREAVVREVPHVRVEIEGAVGRRDPGQPQPRQLGQQQRAVACVLRDRFAQLVQVVEGGERGVLRHRGRRQEEVDEVRRQAMDAVLGRHQPAEAPAGHAEELREAVDDDGIGIERERGGAVEAVGDAVIDLVGHDARAVGAAALDERLQRGPVEHRARRIARARDDEAVQPEAVEHRRREAERGFGAAGNVDRRAAQSAERVAVRGIARPCHPDAVARCEERGEDGDERRRGAAGEQHALRRDVDAIGFAVPTRDPLAERARLPVAARVVVDVGVRGRARRRRHARGGLPEVHRDHAPAGAHPHHRLPADLARVERRDVGAAHRQRASGRVARHAPPSVDAACAPSASTALSKRCGDTLRRASAAPSLARRNALVV